MTIRKEAIRAVCLALCLWTAGAAAAQTPGQADIEALKKTAPRVYLDCGSCDIEYIKTEVTFVNYVRDRKEAQVHILVTIQSTGSGGREYKLNFLGQNEFQGLDDSIQYFSNSTDTDDEVRKGLVKALKIGLAGYAARTPIASRLAVDFAAPPRVGPVADRWNSWVFSLSAEGYFNGEKSHSSHSWGGNASANRITEAAKLRLGLSADFDDDRFEYDGETITSSQESYEFNGLYVASLGAHWSAGVSLDIESSSYDNTRLRIEPAPAVEFNVFPYAESSRRQLRFLYKVKLESARYREETIYFRTRETRLKHSLSATLELKEKWGSISTSISGSQYFHDLGKYQVNHLRQRPAESSQRPQPLRRGRGRTDSRPARPGQGRGQPGRDPAAPSRDRHRLQLLPDGRRQLHLRLDLHQCGQPALRQPRQRRHPHRDELRRTEMLRRHPRTVAFLLAALWATAASLSGQITDKPPAAGGEVRPLVWIEGGGLTGTALQADLPFVLFVSDRSQAQVLVSVEPDQVRFTGLGAFEACGTAYDLKPEPGEPADAFKVRLIQTIRLGLLRFASKCPAAGLLSVRLLDAVKPTSVVDPWKFWVFSLSGNSFLMGEQSYAQGSWFGSVSANRVTPNWKIRMAANISLSQSRYRLDDYDYTSSSTSTGFSGLAAKSLGEHWSAGLFLQVSRSTYDNTLWSVNPRPAIEYNIFPYSESTKRQLRLMYTVGPTLVRYEEATIFDKTRETLFGQSLSAAIELKQPWGDLNASLTGSHYFHDLKKYRVELDAGVSIRLFKGFNLNLDGSGSRIHDQLNLPKGGASYEEVLLQRKQMATGYNYRFSVGFSYRFGSIFSNIINPRFGNSDGFSMSISM